MVVWAIGMGVGFAVADRAATMPVDVSAWPASLHEAESERAAARFAERHDQGPGAAPVANVHEAEGPPAADADRQDPLATAPQAVPRSKSKLVFFILGRNSAVYLWLLAGLLSAGTVTFVVLAYNGIQLGLTIGLALQAGMPGRLLAELILPHGVLEVGAFCIAGAVGFQGLRLGTWSRHGWGFVKALRLGWVLAFGAGALTCAAAIEAYVTSAFLA